MKVNIAPPAYNFLAGRLLFNGLLQPAQNLPRGYYSRDGGLDQSPGHAGTVANGKKVSQSGLQVAGQAKPEGIKFYLDAVKQGVGGSLPRERACRALPASP